jgi:hypothetical protein
MLACHLGVTGSVHTAFFCLNLPFALLSPPCLEYAANYRRIIVCWHRRIGRRMAVCAGSIALCVWILYLCGLKHRAQIQKCSRTNGVSQWPRTGKKNPTWFQTAQMKKRHAQGFPAFDTAETAAHSKHGVGVKGSIHTAFFCLNLPFALLSPPSRERDGYIMGDFDYYTYLKSFR